MQDWGWEECIYARSYIATPFGLHDVHMNKKVRDRSVKFSPLAEMLHLKQDVYGYSYLSESGCSYVLTMDDDKQFTITTVSCFVKLSPLKHLSYM